MTIVETVRTTGTRGPERRWLRALLSITVAMSLLAACGDDDAGDAEGLDEQAPTEASAGADEAAPDTVDDGTDTGAEPGADDGTDVAAPEPETPLVVDVGDLYENGEFEAIYQGMAQIPVGPDVFEGGACYVLLWEATFLDPLDVGEDAFSPAVDAYLSDGRIAEDDVSGVGCDQGVLADAGYAQAAATSIPVGDAMSVYSGPFHVAEADIGTIDIITLFGTGPERGGVAPTITLDLAG